MSYDLTARSNASYSAYIQRTQALQVITRLPGIETCSQQGLVFRRGHDIRMEIDLECVNEEGDNIEDFDGPPSAEINRISCHIPYASANGLDSCYEMALKIAEALDWELYDLQMDQVVSEMPRRKPWWKVW